MSSYDTSGLTEMNELFKDTGFNFDIRGDVSRDVVEHVSKCEVQSNHRRVDVSSVTSFKECFTKPSRLTNRRS